MGGISGLCVYNPLVTSTRLYCSQLGYSSLNAWPEMLLATNIQTCANTNWRDLHLMNINNPFASLSRLCTKTTEMNDRAGLVGQIRCGESLAYMREGRGADGVFCHFRGHMKITVGCEK